MLPNFIEDCNRLLPDGAADSARCMGLCAHTCVAQQCLHANTVCKWFKKKYWPPNSPNLNPLRVCLENDAHFFETFIWSQIQFLD